MKVFLLLVTLPIWAMAPLKFDSLLKESTNKPDQVFLLHAWASWCTNCGRSLKALHDAKTKAGKSAANVKLIAVSIDEESAVADAGAVKKGLKQMKSYRLLFDPIAQQIGSDALGDRRLGGVPEVMVIKNGKIVENIRREIKGDQDFMGIVAVKKLLPKDNAH